MIVVKLPLEVTSEPNNIIQDCPLTFGQIQKFTENQREEVSFWCYGLDGHDICAQQTLGLVGIAEHSGSKRKKSLPSPRALLPHDVYCR